MWPNQETTVLELDNLASPAVQCNSTKITPQMRCIAPYRTIAISLGSQSKMDTLHSNRSRVRNRQAVSIQSTCTVTEVKLRYFDNVRGQLTQTGVVSFDNARFCIFRCTMVHHTNTHTHTHTGTQTLDLVASIA